MFRTATSLAFVLAASVALAQEPRLLPQLEEATAVFASASGERIEWKSLGAALAKVDVVFLGETHLDDTTHRVELAVLEELLRVRSNEVVLSLEMFERDVQPALDAYCKGEIDEATFLQRSRPWGNYQSDYRPLIETAKAAGIPIVAANFPALLRRKLGMGGGKDAISKLSADERAFMPETILPASDAYWQRVDRATRGHMGGAPGTTEERLYDGQNLWDNAMGDAVAKAHRSHPGKVVLHVAGGFHTAYRDGTVKQCMARAEGIKIATVAIATAGAMHSVQPTRDFDQADYLVYAQAVARSEFEGTFAVTVAQELRYLLHLPDSAAGTAPLLVFVPDAGEDPRDALAFWQHAIGDAAAIAVVEHAFPQAQQDLGRGGRWNSGDGFRSDYGAVQQGLEQIVEYLTRRLPIDGTRTLVAGRGDGGAAVLWTALYGSWLRSPMLALAPTDLSRLSMEGLPDKAPMMARLTITFDESVKAKVEKIANDYRSVGAQVELAAPLAGKELTAAVRAQLGLAAVAVSAAPDARHFVVLERDLPRARQWAEIQAAQMRGRGLDAEVVLADAVPKDTPRERVHTMAIGGDSGWPAEGFATGAFLPLAGGSFGGTTLLVMPAGSSQHDYESVLALETAKVIKRRSMFANLAVARIDAEPTLPQVLDALRQKGRSRVLIVPFQFCASADEMQNLQRAVGDSARGMDLHWLPGLGAELVR
jgi:uncharacterized iron-regulated protein